MSQPHRFKRADYRFLCVIGWCVRPIRGVPSLLVVQPASNLERFPPAFVKEDVSERAEFEFAEHAGVTRQTVSTYIDLLLELDVVEEVSNTTLRRYQVAESAVVQELYELNSGLNAAGE